ncbi:MAG: glutamine--fructose-6-phosphate transaminase (isomerizing) [Lachnospiraceae bacterium]|nr:glutamine--fructose-6-phosphate transaminase (isomerizing) [Lachnospiraceae bacterium]
MCGIVGFVGEQAAAPVLLNGLSRLEYRGYDSAGLCVRDGEKPCVIVKAQGRLASLINKTDEGRALSGKVGIGHTRWATHGEPSEKNAHPHTSDDGNVVGVHNGIIENYQELKAKLQRHDYQFYSETDTEVAVKLIDYYYKKYNLGPVDAINRTIVRVRGSYALAVMFKDYPDEIYVARKDSPLIVGVSQKESFIASDVPAILQYTRSVYYLDNLEIAKVRAGEVVFYNLDGDEVSKECVEIAWDAEAAEKGGFEHFMMKEIHEQPEAVEKTIRSAITEEGKINLEAVGMTAEELQQISQIYIVACGSASHVGYAAQYIIESMAKVPVRVEYASEFRYREMPFAEHSLAIIISQSGETADTLEGLRKAKRSGVKTLAIVNVVGSTIAREADHVFYTLAGPEIAVATTKAYSAQLIAMYAFAMALSQAKGTVDEARVAALVEELLLIPDKMRKVLEDKERIQWFAAKFAAAKDIFFVGRGIDYAVCMEGSLKLKEISYIHSEAYGAGELKHGTISLIEDGILTIGVLTQGALLEKTMSNMVEVRSRGGYLAGVTMGGYYKVEDTAAFTMYVPKTDPYFAASLAVIPLQLLAYYVAVAKGLDVDKPRNLAKSVTVE